MSLLQSITEIDGSNDSQTLTLNSQDTLRSLLEIFANDPSIEHYTTVNVENQVDGDNTRQDVTFSAVLPTDQLNSMFPSYFNYNGPVTDFQSNSMMHSTHPAVPLHALSHSHLRSPTPSSTAPSLTPSMQSFPGMYNFHMELGQQPKDTKSAPWTYSAANNKLYAQKDAAVPVKFSINCPGTGLFIRALPVYTRPEHLQDFVRRCPNHTQAPESANIPHRDHFIWCENQSTSYVQDASGRNCVKVLYDTPAAGSRVVTYLFSFKCLSSCVGGPNRRDMSVIFTLESANEEVLGRQCIDIRVCACPGRDRKSDENRPDVKKGFSPSSSTAKQEKSVNSYNAHTPRSQDVDAEAISLTSNKRKHPDEEIYTLQIKGRKNYDMLLSLRDSLEMADTIPSVEREKFVCDRRKKDQQFAESRTSKNTHHLQNNPPPMVSAFKFSSAFKRDVVDSTQRGYDMTDGSTSPASSTVASWLKSLKLDAYIDDFHRLGLHSMDQLTSERFTIHDLESMKLTKPTVNQIWNSLKSYRATNSVTRTPAPTVSIKAELLPDSQESSVSSQNSAISLSSDSQPKASNLQFTRCSFKFTLLKKRKQNSDEEDTTSKMCKTEK